MYCRNCGMALENNAVVCSKCGATVTPPAPPPYGAQQPCQNPYYNNYSQQPYRQPNQEEDRPSTGFNALAFFFPVVGLILFLVWKDQKPLCTRSIGKWALIGFIASVVLTIILTVLTILIFTMSEPSYYNSGYSYDFAYGLSILMRIFSH